MSGTVYRLIRVPIIGWYNVREGKLEFEAITAHREHPVKAAVYKSVSGEDRIQDRLLFSSVEFCFSVALLEAPLERGFLLFPSQIPTQA